MICVIFMVPTNWFDNVNGLNAASLHFNQDILEINMCTIVELWAYRTRRTSHNCAKQAPGPVNGVNNNT